MLSKNIAFLNSYFVCRISYIICIEKTTNLPYLTKISKDYIGKWFILNFWILFHKIKHTFTSIPANVDEIIYILLSNFSRIFLWQRFKIWACYLIHYNVITNRTKTEDRECHRTFSYWYSWLWGYAVCSETVGTQKTYSNEIYRHFLKHGTRSLDVWKKGETSKFLLLSITLTRSYSFT